MTSSPLITHLSVRPIRRAGQEGPLEATIDTPAEGGAGDAWAVRVRGHALGAAGPAQEVDAVAPGLVLASGRLAFRTPAVAARPGTVRTRHVLLAAGLNRAVAKRSIPEDEFGRGGDAWRPAPRLRLRCRCRGGAVTVSAKAVASGRARVATGSAHGKGGHALEGNGQSRKLSRQQRRAMEREKRSAAGWIAALGTDDPWLRRAIRSALGTRSVTRMQLEDALGMSLAAVATDADASEAEAPLAPDQAPPSPRRK